MPEKETRKRAAKKKSASSKAGEYVREEMDHIREGKHGARSPEQAIAIGLSKSGAVQEAQQQCALSSRRRRSPR